MHDGDLRDGLAEMEQNVIAILTATQRLHGTSEQRMPRAHLPPRKLLSA